MVLVLSQVAIEGRAGFVLAGGTHLVRACEVPSPGLCHRLSSSKALVGRRGSGGWRGNRGPVVGGSTHHAPSCRAAQLQAWSQPEGSVPSSPWKWGCWRSGAGGV